MKNAFHVTLALLAFPVLLPVVLTVLFAITFGPLWLIAKYMMGITIIMPWQI